VYLKRLEMLGFKSFATRTLLEFSTGITAVIGPNGAGKSNVADAIRWVLGEQSMRQLRGKKSEDIIFVGGHGKAALGMAEVSLTIDNSTGWVPSEYSEITVSRRSYRSGESEYLINKQKVRLKDVLLLLAQARIGHDSYTVVGQGLIDAALSLRAEERRGLFEDAAGIRPFQVQRSDAENRLRQTEQNLERLRDIVAEIEPRLGPLKEQARRALENAQLQNELQEGLLTWYALQWRRLWTAKERAEGTEQAQAQKVRQLEQRLQNADGQGNSLRVKRQQTHLRAAEVRQASSEAREAAQKLERELAVDEERVTGLIRQKNEQQQEERRLRERLIAVRQHIIDQEEQCSLADEALDEDAASLATFEAQVTRAQKDYEMDERRLRGAQSDLIQVQARLGASQSDLGRQQKHLGDRNRTLAQRRETMSQSHEILRTLETRLADERSQLDAARGEEHQSAQCKQSLVRTIADAQQEMERLKSALAEAERQRRLVSDRLNMLKSWRQNLSGYSDGVRSLLRNPAQSGKVTGLIGLVPQLGVAHSGLETALEAALGPYLQAVVVHSPGDAYRSLAYLQEKKSGKAMIVWIEDGRVKDDVDDEQYQIEEETFGRFLANVPSLQDRIIGFAWRHVQCETTYVPLFRRMLHGIVIAKDTEAAKQLLEWAISLRASSASNLPFEMVVTLNGEVFHTSGWLTGGSSSNVPQNGLLAYERELRELPQQLGEHNVLIEKLNSMISEVQRGQEGRRAELALVEKALQKTVGRINELTKVAAATQRDQERVQTELRMAASVEQQLAAEIAGLEQEVRSAQERVRAHEKTQREMSGLVEKLSQEMDERATVYRRQQDELGRKRTAIAVKRQEAKAFHQQLALQQAQAQDLKTQLDSYMVRIKDIDQRQQALQETFVHQRAALEAAQARAQTLSQDLNIVEEQAKEVDREIAVLEQQTIQLRSEMAEMETVYRRCLLDSQKARDAVDSLLEQLQEEMGMADPMELTSYAARSAIESSSEPGTSPVGAGLAPAHLAPAPLTLPAHPGSTPIAVFSPDKAETGTLSDAEESQLRKLRRRVDGLRGHIKALGGSDPDAPQLYEETRTRFEFLSTQITDMEQAALHLRSIIGQLDATMARQFETTFQAVNARFREHFTTLFNGGHARLELTVAKESEDDHDNTKYANNGNNGLNGSNGHHSHSNHTQMQVTMPAGVDIIVQPPGKKAQDLFLLSGGERALVSAALLFSLLEINPPPFCLLDEVDAALDESNVTRFCDILKRLAQRTQFIVITHNRVTMTEAQVIYGVSMGSDSISRLLSMRLEEAPVAGDR
jgi:chromosome segregation protein